MFPLTYDEPLFRPPSEAHSLIIQLTLGCSWNRCAFCEMYTSKQFKARKADEVAAEIISLKPYASHIRKVFLGDGNAFVLSSQRLLAVLAELRQVFPKLRRVSAYALPRDIASKTEEELQQLQEAGLNFLYIGIESGDDELLQAVNKNESFSSTSAALQKARKAGFKLSVMVLNGLGGKQFSRQHALNSARVVNEIQPEYLSTLVLSYPYGENHFKQRFQGPFDSLNTIELIAEMGYFIQHLELENTIFRSDHASNYLILKGVLHKDKDVLMDRINRVLNDPTHANLRPEWLRGL